MSDEITGTGIEVTYHPEPPLGLTAHPAAEFYPLIGDTAYVDLAEDIKKNGLRHPVVLYQGTILDGRNRYKVCVEHGLPLKTVEFHGDEKAAVDFIHSANLHRRHLTRAQQRDVIARALKADPTLSDRQIARRIHVDHKTVGAERTEREASGEIPHEERRADTKGRSNPAHKKSKAKKPTLTVIDLAATREASAVTAFAELLHEGDINEHLNKLLKILSGERERITALAKVQRESFVRSVMNIVDLDLDDLRPSAGVPVFEGALH